jgi:hypothetical protein
LPAGIPKITILVTQQTFFGVHQLTLPMKILYANFISSSSCSIS